MLKLVQLGAFWRPLPGRPAQLHMLACFSDRVGETLFTQIPLSLKDGQGVMEHARKGGTFKVTLELLHDELE
jgi:hypothetical protein